MKANESFASISPAARMHPDDLFKVLCEQTLDVAESQSTHFGQHDDWGSYRFDFDFRHGGRLLDDVPGAIMYGSGTHFAEVLQGTYEGRPYFVVAEDIDMGGNFEGTIYISLTGAPEKFIDGIVERYRLERAVSV